MVCANRAYRPAYRPLWLLLLPMLLAACSACALPLFDPFADATASGGTSYTVGSTVTNQYNPALFNAWYQRGSVSPGTTPLIASGSLSYPGLPASTGNSASFGPAASTSACLELNEPANTQSGMIFCSYMLKLTDISLVPTTPANNPFAAFGDDPSRLPNSIGRLGGRVVTKKVGSGFVLGTSRSASTSDFVYEPDGNAHNVGDVLFVVQGYQQVAGGATNINLWINPSAATFGASSPPAPTLAATSGTTALNSSRARLWAMMCQFATAPSGVIDDVRIATDWATVTGGPAIYSVSSNQTYNAGSTATLNVGAFGGAPLGYQWRKNGSTLNNGGNISGATTSTLTISNILAGDAASYSVVVSNSYSLTNSADVVIAVNDPWITVQPTNQALNPNATAIIQVAASGTPILSYQWYKDSSPLSDNGHITGSLTNKLTITSFNSGDVGTYSVTVMNGLATSISSSNAFIGLTDPSISSQPQSITNAYGTTAIFTVTASGTAPFKYQWHKVGVGDLTDGGNISGSKTNKLTLTGVASADSGTYSVTVSNALGAWVESASAVLTVRDPAIITQPLSLTNVEGTTATFHAAAVGTPGLTYTWYKGVNIIFDDGVKYGGAFTDTLSISNVANTDEDTYTLTVLNGNSASESSVPVTLTVVPPPTPITITIQPTSRKVLAGAKTALAVGYLGSEPTFQWRRNGADVPGATGAAYILSNVQAAVTGSYTVVVSNSINWQTSSPAAVVSIVSSLHLYPTNLAVIRVGDGAQSLTTHGNSMFLDQWGPDGSYLSTMTIPDSGPSALVAIGPTVTITPSSVTGNGLSRSANGRFLVIGAYNTNTTYGGELQTAGAGTIPRGIGLVDDKAQYTLAISSGATGTGNFWRGAVADGTNNYWGYSRTLSTYYLGYDAPGVQVQTLWNNLRSMACFNGSLYCVSAVSGKTGVIRLPGLPTAAITLEQLIDTGSNFTSDCDVSPNGTLIYVADNRAGGSGGGIQRWEFNGSTWNLVYTLSDNVTAGAYYVAADFSGPNPVLYAITADQENNQIVKFTDTGSGSTGTIIAYAGANQNFRGARMGPVATTNTTQPPLSETSAQGSVILNWSGSFFLQSSPVAQGPYTDIINGTRPYTNSTSGSQMFFRLRQ
jgi:hypothetical protein